METLLQVLLLALPFSMETLLLQVLLLAFLAIVIYRFLSRRNKSSLQEPPEPSGKLPIIGHLLQLRGKQTLYRTLGSMADSYGSIFTIWLGQRRVMVVSSWEVAKECLTVHDKALAARPALASGKYMNYNYTMFGSTPYGPKWRESRKVATLHLLSARQLELLKHVRSTELELSIKQLHNLWRNNGERPTKVEFKKWLADLSFNNVVMMVAGKRYYGENVEVNQGEAPKYRETIEKLFYLSGVIVMSDCLPWLEWLDVGGYIRAMKQTMVELDALASGWIEEHRRRKESGESRAGSNVVDVMLSMVDSFQGLDCDPEIFIKAMALTLILAGSDTTYVTMTWLLTLLLNHPHVLKKAQEELDNVVGNSRNVDESDIPNLPYLQAIVKETLRLYPAGPLSVPHEAIEDCNIGGFQVPAGTQILFNLWKIQRDPSVWEDPSQFMPERFLTTHKNVDLKGQHFELIPFGSGRRMCPGMTFALQLVHLTIAWLLHAFEMVTPGNEPLDMSEGLGLTMPKATALDVVITPRLSSNLYHF